MLRSEPQLRRSRARVNAAGWARYEPGGGCSPGGHRLPNSIRTRAACSCRGSLGLDDGALREPRRPGAHVPVAALWTQPPRTRPASQLRSALCEVQDSLACTHALLHGLTGEGWPTWGCHR